jgi:hypothetical protein
MRTSVLLILSLLPAVVFGGEFRTESFHGDVVVRSSGEKQMVVLHDSCGLSDDHDGRADHAWVIASEIPYANPVSIYLRNAIVISERRRVTVYSEADQAAIVFLLESEDADCEPRMVHRFAGYGLSQYRGVLEVPPITSDAPLSPHDPDPWGEGDSPGPAASQ